MVSRSGNTSRLSILAILIALALTCAPQIRASDEVILDAAALTVLEQQASAAQFKEQCFLYAQLLHSLTEIAGKQLADGNDEEAASTFKHIDSVAAKMEAALARDAKRLKNAELLMEHTTRRLTDMVHITSGEQRETLQSTLKHVSTLHSQLLTQVFAK
jgi:hypothetical protein